MLKCFFNDSRFKFQGLEMNDAEVTNAANTS